MDKSTKLFLLLTVACLQLLLTSCQQSADFGVTNPESIPSNPIGTPEATPTPSAQVYEDDFDFQLEILQVDSDAYITTPDLYGEYVVYANWNDVTNETRKIHMLNINTKEDQIIYSLPHQDYDSMIDDVCIGDGWIFWVEGHWTTEDLPTDWAIKSYNIQTKETRTIRESSELGGTITLAPRLDNEDNTIVWMEGYGNSEGEYFHTVYTYNADTDDMLLVTDVSSVFNPFSRIRIRNHTISFYDTVDNADGIRVIDLADYTEMFVETGCLPYSVCSNGEYAAWKKEAGALYVYCLADGKTTQVSDSPFLCDMYGDNLYYSEIDPHHLYRYSLKTGKTTCLTTSFTREYERVWVDYPSVYGNTMVCDMRCDRANEEDDIKKGRCELLVIRWE